MGDFRKNILQTDFERKKKPCKEIPAIQWLCIIGKTNFITKGLRKKILTQTKSPLTPLKSQMVGAYLIQVSSSAGQHQTGRQSSTGESVFKKALCHLEETLTDYIKTVATTGIYVIYEDTSVADS